MDERVYLEELEKAGQNVNSMWKLVTPGFFTGNVGETKLKTN